MASTAAPLLALFLLACCSLAAARRPATSALANVAPCPFTEGDFDRLYRNSTSPPILDSEVPDFLYKSPNDPLYRKVALVSRMFWPVNFRLANCYANMQTDCDPRPGAWLAGTIKVDQAPFTVVHWDDLDDDSYSVYFRGDDVCAVVYEN